MSVTKKPQAKAPTMRNAKAIQSVDHALWAHYVPFLRKITLGQARVTTVTLGVKPHTT
jgi:hypothetical protein